MTVGDRRSAGGVRRGAVPALAVTALLFAAGCATFDDSASAPFTPEPSFSAADIEPVEPGAPGSETTAPAAPRELGPCEDPDQNVVATCLDTLGGLVTLPGGASALVAERRTGTIFEVAPGTRPTEFATVPVDGSSDGGLLDIALSPTYAEDRLIYAYITTASDNRVVRIAAGDVPKNVLTGIPRGTTGNSGALDFWAPNELRVITGDAGSPSNAADPSSLAGKVLSVTGTTSGTTAPPRVLMSGIGRAGDVCMDPNGSTWVTDSTATEDRLSRITPEGAVVTGVWTWPDRPGVGGCAVGTGSVSVSMSGARALATVPIDPQTGAVPTPPTLLAQDKYGRLRGAAMGAEGQVWVSTVNKDGGAPTPTDDRVVIIPVPSGGGGSD